MAVQNGAGLFDEGADWMADDFFLDAAGGGGFADDQVDALKVSVRWCARVIAVEGGRTAMRFWRERYFATAKSPMTASLVFSKPGMSAMRRMM